MVYITLGAKFSMVSLGFRVSKYLGGPGHLDVAGDKAQCQVVAISPEHQAWKDLPKKTMGHGRTLGSSSAR